MRRLILLRHGKAEARAASGSDLDRALTDAGRAAAAAAGRALEGAGITPDLALVSHAVRTRQTWEEASAAWSTPPASRETEGLYGRDAHEVLRLARGADADTVLLVGHNPGLESLAAALGRGDARLAGGFPPASAAVFEPGDDGWRVAFAHYAERGA